jgi:hypothetical protein
VVLVRDLHHVGLAGQGAAMERFELGAQLRREQFEKRLSFGLFFAQT